MKALDQATWDLEPVLQPFANSPRPGGRGLKGARPPSDGSSEEAECLLWVLKMDLSFLAHFSGCLHSGGTILANIFEY